MSRKTLPDVFYIVHSENLPSIQRHGVLSHHAIDAEGIDYKKIYDEDVVNRRKGIKISNGSSLWEFANFYFNPRNPMLYRVYVCEKKDVVILKMKKGIHNLAKYIAVGNAASGVSEILPYKEGMKKIQMSDTQKLIHAESWPKEGEGKRIIMSELLVPQKVPPELIDTIYTPQKGNRRIRLELSAPQEESSDLFDSINAPNQDHMLPRSSRTLDLVHEPNLFFKNSKTRKLSNTAIKLIDGDMFFSKQQTITISVNTVGVMGGGLAARARDNFPHVYVKFQKLCREKKLTTKKPFLYKEDYSLDEHMADESSSLTDKPNAEKWFLLFATKEHWRNPSKMQYIKDGLQWLVDNVEKNKIKSLALPALGCGLGRLTWEIVGPVMCQYLHQLDIPCEIYLPREKTNIPDAQLSAEFLLGG